jgi:hypothetical protein
LFFTKPLDSCPSTRLLIQMGLPLCSEAGLAMFDYCITGPQICPDQPGPTNCPAFQVARRLLMDVNCKDPESDACKNPDKSKASCKQGGGNCGGYR